MAKSVQLSFWGERVACAAHRRKGLEKLLTAKRATRGTWTAKQWKDVVQNVRKMKWGAQSHGGRREGVKSKVKATALAALPPVAPAGPAALGASTLASATRIKEAAALVAVTGPPAALGASTARTEEVAEQVAVTRFDAGVTVHRLLGAGSYGRVYAATSAASGAMVAIKVMKCAGLGDLTEEQYQELKVLTRLNGHAHIVRLLHVTMTTFTVELMLERCDTNLWERIHKDARPLAPEECKAYTLNLFDGLSYIHSLDILHRDIKPPNLLINTPVLTAERPLAPGALKIADFGLARAVVPDAVLDTNAYTLWYRPPEVLLGSPDYSYPADVWAAACTCVEMVLGRVAFERRSEAEVIRAIFATLGLPSRAEWPVLRRLPKFKAVNAGKSFPSKPRPAWGLAIGGAYHAMLMFVLEVAPALRCTAADACVWCRGGWPLAAHTTE